MADTKIQWADKVWNVVTGCDKVSSGCKNCFAESIAKRFWKDRLFTDVRCHLTRMNQPLSWQKPQTIFVCSMGDIFHEKVSNSFREDIWNTMALCSQPTGFAHHKFIILTKRPQNIHQFELYLEDKIKAWGEGYKVWYDNIILGVSVEDQKTADERIPILLEIQAKTRIVSIEPCLGEIHNLVPYLRGWKINADYKQESYEKLDGVIFGCESGANRRHFDEKWACSVLAQCLVNGTPFFYKQGRDLGDKVIKMPELDGRVWDQLPEVK